MNRRPPSSTLFPTTTLSRPPPETKRAREGGGGSGREASRGGQGLARPPVSMGHGATRHMTASLVSADGDATGARTDPSRIVDRKSTRLNSSHLVISYAVFCL